MVVIQRSRSKMPVKRQFVTILWSTLDVFVVHASLEPITCKHHNHCNSRNRKEGQMRKRQGRGKGPTVVPPSLATQAVGTTQWVSDSTSLRDFGGLTHIPYLRVQIYTSIIVYTCGRVPRVSPFPSFPLHPNLQSYQSEMKAIH